jgi:hypothetical protein
MKTPAKTNRSSAAGRYLKACLILDFPKVDVAFILIMQSLSEPLYSHLLTDGTLRASQMPAGDRGFAIPDQRTSLRGPRRAQQAGSERSKSVVGPEWCERKSIIAHRILAIS